MKSVVVDGEGCILGRLASVVAKRLLKGEKVFIVNAEKVIISGRKEDVLERLLQKRRRGDPYNGPFFPKGADGIVRRVIRGMLPYKKPRGREAFKNLKVFISFPEELKGCRVEKIEEARKKLTHGFVELREVLANMGG